MRKDRAPAHKQTLLAPRGRTFGAVARHDGAERLGSVAGAIDDPPIAMPPQRVAVAARPHAKAAALIEALTETEGALLVATGDDVRPLRLLFGPRSGAIAFVDKWLEVRVTGKDILVERVPDTPISVAAIPELAKAFAALRAKYPKATATDVLVAADVDAQRLVAVLAALDAAGARAIELGSVPAPGDPQAKLRGTRILRVSVGTPSASAIPRDQTQTPVRDAHAKLLACYETALAAKPELGGVVVVEIAIDAKGKVTTVNATGVDPDLATCMAGVIKAIKFPAGKDATRVRLPIAVRW
jgi:hypothetical protein